MKRNFVDKFVSFVNPAAGLSRLKARAQMTVAERHLSEFEEAERRRYDAASKSRLNNEWFSGEVSVNTEILSALAMLRNRSRDLCRNNGYAIQGVRMIKNNVVGTGIIPTPRAEGISKSQLKKLKTAWEDWASVTECDFDGMSTFYGIQSLVMKTVVESGECIIRRVYGNSKQEIPLKLQILEGDFIDGSKHDGTWQSDDTMLFYGIKIHRDGTRLGYWIYKSHPNEFGLDSEFVPAKDIVHVYEVERPGQIRGVPFSSSVMGKLKDLGDFEYAELVRMKIAASFSVFITEDAINDGSPAASPNKDRLTKIQPGMIAHLTPGQQIQTAQPPNVEGGEGFVKNNLRSVSAGFGTSYEGLTNDYSNVNFSSGRMGRMEFQGQVEHLQYNLMIPRFCNKIFPWFLEACRLKGIISFEGKVRVSWTAPRKQMIDPYKEIQAIKEKLRAGLASWTDVVKEFGYVPDELLEEIKNDKEMWDKLGLAPTIDPRFDSNRPLEKPDQLMEEDQK
ncbi:phage portal protein [Parasegetibacter sp. NRK P23]|uniref:phage portal protein n=1 Tax=Parasegetibacter sp. NRK P23 TaxID=2942999 RepID=UPI00204468C8|nr:phage portal protein [Parasegetibacter sp. NRK P23]MCM5528959.1 phage portal protein [Parasegetibacter sp. NRK P23]